MFTGGIGKVAQGASKIRHARKLKSLGSIFRDLKKLLKRKNNETNNFRTYSRLLSESINYLKAKPPSTT
jgi:hypothetical protein